MSKKCKDCQHHAVVEVPRFRFSSKCVIGTMVKTGVCTNIACTTEEIREQFPNRKGMPIDMAREICVVDGQPVHFKARQKEATK